MRYHVDARSRQLGGTGLAATGTDALWLNPAGLATTERLTAAATTEQRFGVRGLHLTSVGLRTPQGFGLRMAALTAPGYAVNRVGVLYGRKVADRWTVGAAFDLLYRSVDGYGGDLAVATGAGLQFHWSKSLTLACALFQSLPSDGVPGWIAVGGSYRPGPNVAMFLDVERAMSKTALRCGVEYLPVSTITLRAGVRSRTEEVSLGVAYRLLKRWEVSVGTASHLRLGTSPVFGLVLRP
ncbi:hypothetical protein [Lewinella sp. JB7]|uniref:hypothetical protein n=1 Tax=Lewinella sp. JB7 TaxID=2962887 RepID=UPI0020C9806F|nr:hypothetical protein [Lewinella sp. JB7]MCP9235316.1 hypothetical protein [Lewinella sp. JB7]